MFINCVVLLLCRVSTDDSSSCEMFPVIKFDVNVVRSLLENPVDVPLLDVNLKLPHVKLCVYMCCVCVCVCVCVCACACVRACERESIVSKMLGV